MGGIFLSDDDPPTLRRLNALMAKGYRIDTGGSQRVKDAVWLDHPAVQRVQAKTLILYSDGLVVSESAQNPEQQLRFEPARQAEFSKFVSEVPFPNLWERSHEVRSLSLSLAIVGLIVFVPLTILLSLVGLLADK